MELGGAHTPDEGELGQGTGLDHRDGAQGRVGEDRVGGPGALLGDPGPPDPQRLEQMASGPRGQPHADFAAGDALHARCRAHAQGACGVHAFGLVLRAVR